jgi:DNA-binding SARP family transcriptional activator/tetratricopeptide (TPR) repeat protein
MDFRLLGPLEVFENGRVLDLGGAKQRALLAVLLLHANRVVSSDQLLEALWGERPPDTAQKALQVYVSKLRKALGRDRILTKTRGYQAHVEEGELDLDRFQGLASEGRREEALSLFRGRPLADFAYEPFAQAEIARLDELRFACLEERIEDDLARGRHGALVGELEALVREHPLRERLRGQLMLALYRSGRQAEALEAYQAGRRHLSEELGLEPGERLKELQRAILSHDPSLDVAAQPPSAEKSALPLETPPRLATTATREVRKSVTVLFGDVTPSGGELDPESLRRMTTRGFDVLLPVLERHGATVERSLGGAVTAIFGIPAVHEDDALRGVRAAVEMRERLDGLNDELQRQWGGRLVLRVGISTGEVVAGGDAGQPYATGDPVQSAIRLQQAAQPGELLLGERTHRLVRDAVDTEPIGEHHRLLRVHPPLAGHPSRFDSPMVGRERERRRLQDAFEQAIADRSCQLFTILGPAGAGKSRLVQEFADDVSERALVVRGRCLPYGEGITYWPVIEVLKDTSGFDDTESPDESRRKLAEVLEGEEEAELTVQRLAELVGLAEAQAGVEESFRAVRTFFETLARRHPLVVVFDDIHWGEATFLELVDHVTDWSRDAPILLVCVARPELLDVRADWGGGKLNTTSVLLEPLSEAESVQLVQNLAGTEQLDETTQRQIVEAADGNPLFVEEMFALLHEDGRADGRLEVPPTIQALLAARLDRLADEERWAIEAASVEGKVFHEGSVAEIGSAVPSTVHGQLMTLVRKELVRPHRPVFLGERAFRFRHLLIRDAAYESIPKEARASLHERHAGWLERKAGERTVEYEEIIGYHLEQAFRYRSELGPIDETGRALGRRAAERLGAAGRRAFTRIDPPAAVNLISRAVALLPTNDPLRVELVPNVRAIQGTSEFGWAEAILDEAIAAGDPRLEAHARVQRGFLRLFFTAPEITPPELMRVAQDAIDVFDRIGDDLGLARAWRLIAQAHYLARRGAQSAEAATRALEFGRRAGDHFEQLETIEWLGIALVLGPIPAPEGARRCEELLQEVSGDARLELTVLGALAYLVGIQGRAQEAEELIARGRNAMSANGESGWLFPVLLAFYFSWVSEPAVAERDLRPVYDQLKKVGEKSHFCSVATMLAQAVYAQGRYDEADELARDAERTARPNDVHSHIVWRGTRAKVLARRGELDAAEALAREAVAYAAKSDFLHSHADALTDLAEVLQLAGRTAEAAAAVDEAMHLHEQKGNVVAAARARSFLEDLGPE